MLIDLYNECKKGESDVAKGKKFEVVFCSSDRSEEDWKGYRGTMPWLDVGFSDER